LKFESVREYPTDDRNIPRMETNDLKDGSSRFRNIQSKTEITIGVEFLNIINVSTFAFSNIFKFENNVNMNAKLTTKNLLKLFKFGSVRKKDTIEDAMH